MNASRNSRVLRLSDSLYHAMLHAYPADFRRRFGRHMEQVFRTSSGATLKRAGMYGLVLLWLDTAADLIATATRERLVQMESLTMVVGLCAVVLACFTGLIHTEADSDRLAVGIVVGGAFICGAMRPSRSWLWSLIIGAGIPLALLVGHHAVAGTVAHDPDTPSLLSILPAMIAGYVGARTGLLTLRYRFQ